MVFCAELEAENAHDEGAVTDGVLFDCDDDDIPF